MLIKLNFYFNMKGMVFDFIVVYLIFGLFFILIGFEFLRYNCDYVIFIFKFLLLKKIEFGEYF